MYRRVPGDPPIYFLERRPDETGDELEHRERMSFRGGGGCGGSIGKLSLVEGSPPSDTERDRALSIALAQLPWLGLSVGFLIASCGLRAVSDALKALSQ